MRTKSWLLSGLLVGWAALALGAGSYNLAFKYKQGEISKYKNAIHMEVSGAAIPGGKLVITEESTESQKIISVGDDGSGEVESTISGFVQKINGEKNPSTASLITGIPQEIPTVSKVSRDGRILSMRLTKEPPASDKAKIEAALKNMKNRGVKFPEKALKMGESWSNDEVLSNEVPGMGVIDVTLKLKYVLAAEEKLSGFQCVRIDISGAGTGTMGEGKGAIEITLKGSVWVAPKEGMLIKVHSEEIDKIILFGPEGQVELGQVATVSSELLP